MNGRRSRRTSRELRLAKAALACGLSEHTLMAMVRAQLDWLRWLHGAAIPAANDSRLQ